MMFSNQPSILSGYDPRQLQASMAATSAGAPSVMSGYASSPPMGSFQPVAPTANPDQAFTWGEGGARLSPDQLALRQKAALAQVQAGMDYSPVQSWTQGLARVANAAVGAWDLKRLDKQDAAAQANRQDSIAALLASGSGNSVTHADDNSAVAAALMSSDPMTQKLGMAQWERDHPKPVNNDTVADYNFRVATLGKQAADDWLRRGGDPFITASLPGGQFYAGPQSGFAAAISGQPDPAAVPTAPVGKLTPIEGGAAPQGAAIFR